MTFGVSVKQTGLSEALKTAEIIAAMGAMKAMARAGDGLKEDLRNQVRAAGLSERLANTWQNKVYPVRGRTLTPAAYVFSKAPGVIDAYARGVTIVAKAGRRLLAVPTEDTPKKSSGGKGRTARAMTPKEVEARFGRRLRFVPVKGGYGPSRNVRATGYLLLDDVVARKSTGRYRKASERELSGKSRTGRRVESVVMFLLVASVKVPKKLDLAGALNRAATTLPQLLAEEWSR